MRPFLISLVVSVLLQQPRGAVIEGTVRTVDTNAPLSGAVVVASGGASNALVQTTTDTEGRFKLNVNPGRYTLFARKSGFVSEQQSQRSETGTVVIVSEG